MSETVPDEFQLVPPPVVAAGATSRRFNPWLVAAMLVHAAVLGGMISAKPRQMGDANGMDGAISISLVSEAELRGDATVADRAAGDLPPMPSQSPALQEPAQPQSESEPQQQPEQQPSETEAETADQLPAEFKTTLTPEAMDAAEPAKPQDAAKPAAKKTPKTEETSKAPSKPQEAKPAKPKETKTAKLDPSLPPSMSNAPPGSRGAGIERPAGITRSGENDAFARGVIRALQQTMPQLRDTRGRVRVRITLDKNGNIVSTQVLMPSNVPGLDQSVVFATRQTNFPLPPYNATPADLVFVVTYIYL